MGRSHLRNFVAGKIPDGVVTAICDINEGRLSQAAEIVGPQVATYTDANKLMESGLVDAVLIATQHYFHPDLAIMAFEHDLHVMSEKPGVYTGLSAENECCCREIRTEVWYHVSAPRSQFTERCTKWWHQVYWVTSSGSTLCLLIGTGLRVTMMAERGGQLWEEKVEAC